MPEQTEPHLFSGCPPVGEFEEKPGLPDGWTDVALSGICELNPPKPPANAVPPDTPVTFVPMPAVDADAGAIKAPQVRCFGEVRKGFTSFREEDVILAKITPCFENGKAAICRGLRNGLGFGSTEFHVLRTSGVALPEYLYYFVRQEWFRHEGESNMTGSVGQKRVPADWIAAMRIPLPPLAEQKRIVAKVEEVLARVNAARVRLAKLPAIVRRFRQSVLAAACSGRLTADWREDNPDLPTADELLQTIARSHRYPVPNLEVGDNTTPDGWRCCTLGFITEPGPNGRPFATSGSRGWAKYVGSSGSHFIRSENINTEYLKIDDTVRVAAPAGAEASRTQVRAGDLLLTITGNNVGRTAVVPPTCPTAYVSQHVAIIRVSRQVDAEYVWLWLQSIRHGQDQLQAHFYGYTKPGLNLDQIRGVRVNLPPLQEQREIVRRVRQLLALTDKIETMVAAGTLRTDKLVQATLAKAFRGELVPTEAELAEREGREYETAETLLARIRRQRADSRETPISRRRRPSTSRT